MPSNTATAGCAKFPTPSARNIRARYYHRRDARRCTAGENREPSARSGGPDRVPGANRRALPRGAGDVGSSACARLCPHDPDGAANERRRAYQVAGLEGVPLTTDASAGMRADALAVVIADIAASKLGGHSDPGFSARHSRREVPPIPTVDELKLLTAGVGRGCSVSLSLFRAPLTDTSISPSVHQARPEDITMRITAPRAALVGS
jgi:hypothetical protein